jgi:hypothetical protein
MKFPIYYIQLHTKRKNMMFLKNKYLQLRTLMFGISAEEQQKENFSLVKYTTESYINPELTVEKKIALEKQRRHQAYMAVDYLASVVSYVDFFCPDTLRIVKKATELSQLLEKEVVTSDLLLLPYFDVTSNKEVITLLEKYGVTKKLIADRIANSQAPISRTFQEKTFKLFSNIFFKIDIPMLSEFLTTPQKTVLEYEINSLFEIAAENAATRFKTPVISSEILLITMLETKKTKVGKALRSCLKNDLNLYLLRFGLLKRLHAQELAIRIDLPSNYQYFAYLLKANLLQSDFETMLDKNYIEPAVLLFRNMLIVDAVQVDIGAEIKKEIRASIKANSRKAIKRRRYSEKSL